MISSWRTFEKKNVTNPADLEYFFGLTNKNDPQSSFPVKLGAIHIFLEEKLMLWLASDHGVGKTETVTKYSAITISK